MVVVVVEAQRVKLSTFVVVRQMLAALGHHKPTLHSLPGRHDETLKGRDGRESGMMSCPPSEDHLLHGEAHKVTAQAGVRNLLRAIS